MFDSDPELKELSEQEEKFETAYVYKILSTHPDIQNLPYVGSTPRELNLRLIEHQSAARGTLQKYKLYKAMKHYGIDTFDIHEVEVLHNVTRQDLYNREEYWITRLDSIVNGFNDKHGNRWCIAHNCDRRRCPCGGSHLCGCENKKPCKMCKGDIDEVKICNECDKTGVRTVYVRREQCSTHGGNQMCPKHPTRSRAYCTAPECKDTALGLCEHGSRKHECSQCRPCTICPVDEYSAPANPKHLNGKKHGFNVNLRRIIISRANPSYTEEQKQKYVDLVITHAEQNDGPFQRLSDHRRLKAYQFRLNSYITANPVSHPNP